jgi:N-methylhydantoinase A/oxoprolinase/acetone carboxylase beta subunit
VLQNRHRGIKSAGPRCKGRYYLGQDLTEENMTLLLGIDTGGTYSDAVLIEDETRVIASAKALTTRHDLSIGIGEAVAAVLLASGADPAQIAMASLSTTLATNALVEGQGERVGLVYIGFQERDLETHGLRDALKGDPWLVMQGGHNHAGAEAAAFDAVALEQFLKKHGDVQAFAVAAQFATRNPAHEVQAAAMIAQITGVPVSCSHQLSAKLNGPKRAMTAVLNARLIGMIDRLIASAQSRLAALGVTAPLMVVRGDGALIGAQMARARPIETILSGPAASLVGARWLTQADDALVSDIGGTTTDIAVLRNGRPEIDPMGAQVGPYRTMVEAVAMRTHGLGGDSEVHFLSEGLEGGVRLGPRRLVPVSLIAMDAPEAVIAALESQLRSPMPGEHDGRFVRAVPGARAEGLDPKDAAFLARITHGVHPLGAVLKTRMEGISLRRLVERGLVQIAGVTPSDACHVLGHTTAWNTQAAGIALQLFGRRRTGAGNMLAPVAADMAQIIVDRLTRQTAIALLETGFAEDAEAFDLPADVLARHVLSRRGLARHRGVLRLDLGLNLPLIGLGASAATYYPAVGELVHAQVLIPEHAGVANAIGAVVGRISMRRSGTVTSPSEGCYRVHLETGPEDFTDAAPALARLEEVLRAHAIEAAMASGAQDVQVTVTKDIRQARTEARDVFLEATLTIEASGRPRIAV